MVSDEIVCHLYSYMKMEENSLTCNFMNKCGEEKKIKFDVNALTNYVV
jgi:hypothetical protein